MSRSPRYLPLDQIKTRLEVLRTVKGLLDRARLIDRSDVESRFRCEVLALASLVIRDTEWTLMRAELNCGDLGAAPVPQDVLDVVRRFNAIGATRLKSLLRAKGPLRWA